MLATVAGILPKRSPEGQPRGYPEGAAILSLSLPTDRPEQSRSTPGDDMQQSRATSPSRGRLRCFRHWLKRVAVEQSVGEGLPRQPSVPQVIQVEHVSSESWRTTVASTTDDEDSPRKDSDDK